MRSSATIKPLTITIDGPAGVGKSTAAQQLAAHLGLMYLDTGATYRVLAYAACQAGLDPRADVKPLAMLARRLPLQLVPGASGRVRVVLRGTDITKAIRTETVSEAAAQLSRHPQVRRVMVQRQRAWSRARGVVAEGRDTGSVVFPRARYKFFLDANPIVRARRRQRELFQLSGRRLPIQRIRQQLHVRDGIDRTRAVGPLVKPAGAVEVDTSRLTAPQVVRLMLRHITRNHSTSRAGPGTAHPGHPRRAARSASSAPVGQGLCAVPPAHGC